MPGAKGRAPPESSPRPALGTQHCRLWSARIQCGRSWRLCLVAAAQPLRSREIARSRVIDRITVNIPIQRSGFVADEASSFTRFDRNARPRYNEPANY
jgi:hypothetical protein